MSKGRKSSYPEKPPFPRPKKPSKGRNRPSSNNSSKKSRTWQQKAVAVAGHPVKEAEAKLDSRLCVVGHMNTPLAKFLRDNVYNRVRIRAWGGRSFLEV